MLAGTNERTNRTEPNRTEPNRAEQISWCGLVSHEKHWRLVAFCQEKKKKRVRAVGRRRGAPLTKRFFSATGNDPRRKRKRHRKSLRSFHTCIVYVYIRAFTCYYSRSECGVAHCGFMYFSKSMRFHPYRCPSILFGWRAWVAQPSLGPSVVS